MGALRINLVDTSTAGRPGSMRRYAEMVQAALASLTAESRPTVTLTSLDSVPAARPRPGRRLANWRHHLVCALRVRGAVDRSSADLVHILDGSHAYLANLMPRRLPVVATVHDLIPLLTARGELPGPRHSLPARILWRLSLRGMRQCRRVVADSCSTADDLQRLGGCPREHLAVAHLPVCCPAPAVGGLESGECGRRAPRGESHPLLLHVGHNAPYKNREGVLRVASLVLRESPLRLVMAGPAPAPALCRLAEDLGLAGALEWRRDVSDAELQSLYRDASVFLFPSLYEGFGWPPLEAMAAGAPVVCSNAASLPEVVGSAALTAGPQDYAGLARHCLDLLRHPDLRAELVRRGYENVRRFTLERFARQLLTVYQEAVL